MVESFVLIYVTISHKATVLKCPDHMPLSLIILRQIDLIDSFYGNLHLKAWYFRGTNTDDSTPNLNPESSIQCHFLTQI